MTRRRPGAATSFSAGSDQGFGFAAMGSDRDVVVGALRGVALRLFKQRPRRTSIGGPRIVGGQIRQCGCQSTQ